MHDLPAKTVTKCSLSGNGNRPLGVSQRSASLNRVHDRPSLGIPTRAGAQNLEQGIVIEDQDHKLKHNPLGAGAIRKEGEASPKFTETSPDPEAATQVLTAPVAAHSSGSGKDRQDASTQQSPPGMAREGGILLPLPVPYLTHRS